MYFGFISNNYNQLYYGKSSMYRLALYDGTIAADLEQLLERPSPPLILEPEIEPEVIVEEP